MLPLCGQWAKSLLESGSDQVVVFWDVMPRWGEKARPHCHHDVAKARLSLKGAGVDLPSVRLLCFENELEAWIAADKRALSAFLSRPSHPVQFPGIKNPHTRDNIKGDLVNAFKNCKCSGYVDLDHALKIVQHLPDLTQLRRIPSFVRFERLITDPDFACTRHQMPLAPA